MGNSAETKGEQRVTQGDVIAYYRKLQLARLAAAETRTVDLTNPDDNPELRRALLWVRGSERRKGRTTW